MSCGNYEKNAKRMKVLKSCTEKRIHLEKCFQDIFLLAAQVEAFFEWIAFKKNTYCWLLHNNSKCGKLIHNLMALKVTLVLFR